MKLFRKVWAYIRHPRKFLRLAGKTSKLILRSAYTNCDGKTITYGHLVLLLIWITANVVFDLDLKWLSPLGPPAKRAGLASVLNLIMVILGGRTCYIADLFGISLQFYYLLHHWMARVAFLQSLVHAGIRVRQQERWTSVSGIGMASGLIFIFINLSSVYYVRKKHIVSFIWCHRLLGCAFLGLLLAHLWLVESPTAAVIMLCIAGISVLSMLYRWARSQKAQVGVSRCCLEIKSPRVQAMVDTQATRVTFRLPRDTAIYPGAYFYIFNEHEPFWRRYLGTPMAVYDWTSSKLSSNEDFASELVFLVEDSPSQTPLLQNNRLAIDGPYGRNLRLEKYDHVFLLAEGIGIASVLPFASALARRRLYDNERKASAASGSNERLYLDRTRRVTLIWAMEQNSQLEWARHEIDQLMNLDPKSKFLHVWLYQPTEPDHRHVFPRLAEVQQELETCKSFPKHCKISYVPENRWSEALRHQLSGAMETAPGTKAAAMCGTPAFRTIVENITKEYPRVDLYGLEHQPVRRRKPIVALSEDVGRQLAPEHHALPVLPPIQHTTHLHTEGSLSGSIIVEEYEMRSMSRKRQLTGNVAA
ncbi:hypothetical protein FOBRF1_011628 [Fusarium oxysporum]